VSGRRRDRGRKKENETMHSECLGGEINIKKKKKNTRDGTNQNLKTELSF
jgi:hypothetical protein